MGSCFGKILSDGLQGYIFNYGTRNDHMYISKHCTNSEGKEEDFMVSDDRRHTFANIDDKCIRDRRSIDPFTREVLYLQTRVW